MATVPLADALDLIRTHLLDPEGLVRAIQGNRPSGAREQAGESALDSGG